MTQFVDLSHALSFSDARQYSHIDDYNYPNGPATFSRRHSDGLLPLVISCLIRRLTHKAQQETTPDDHLSIPLSISPVISGPLDNTFFFGHAPPSPSPRDSTQSSLLAQPPYEPFSGQFFFGQPEEDIADTSSVLIDPSPPPSQFFFGDTMDQSPGPSPHDIDIPPVTPLPKVSVLRSPPPSQFFFGQAIESKSGPHQFPDDVEELPESIMSPSSSPQFFFGRLDQPSPPCTPPPTVISPDSLLGPTMSRSSPPIYFFGDPDTDALDGARTDATSADVSSSNLPAVPTEFFFGPPDISSSQPSSPSAFPSIPLLEHQDADPTSGDFVKFPPGRSSALSAPPNVRLKVPDRTSTLYPGDITPSATQLTQEPSYSRPTFGVSLSLSQDDPLYISFIRSMGYLYFKRIDPSWSSPHGISHMVLLPERPPGMKKSVRRPFVNS